MESPVGKNRKTIWRKNQCQYDIGEKKIASQNLAFFSKKNMSGNSNFLHYFWYAQRLQSVKVKL
jgi:hypothetical protein